MKPFCRLENFLIHTRLQPGGSPGPGEKPFETVFLSAIPPVTALKRGVNE